MADCNDLCAGVWQKVLQPIESFRRETQAIKVFSNFITGEDLFGLTEAAIVRITESLPGVETLSDYNFRFGRSPLLELPLAINPTGCARSEPKLRTHFKSIAAMTGKQSGSAAGVPQESSTVGLIAHAVGVESTRVARQCLKT
ncbi:hypothetical protein HPB51_020638 [Rhipicephalus microplus]|uniref:Uncharacterized protein n=1 Tax=Rhipicephalus microplus TaxID=6941 RepID=A0A9J6DP07_RHIMP|nr:hypothetical protein HPB51_020638 [Rhipicephalus microplus]